jgi:hypothetical protein
MISLSNDQLEVTVLDPVEDARLLGSRYCAGGYVWQVADRRLGNLLSGPGYPAENPPPVFDGQGLPESFRDVLWHGIDPRDSEARPAAGAIGLKLGVGLVRASDDVRAIPVQTFSRWEITRTTSSIVMRTSQDHAGWAATVTRTLRLLGRTLVSETALANTGRGPIHFRWFPHPFFPNTRGECCKFNVQVTCAENPGFTLADNGWLTMKLDHEWNRQGHFLALPYSPAERLVTVQKHPLVGLIVATCSFVPTFLTIWGNVNTFSFEPYTEQDVAPGATSTWSVVYDF